MEEEEILHGSALEEERWLAFNSLCSNVEEAGVHHRIQWTYM
jgi:hypothetical protein